MKPKTLARRLLLKKTTVANLENRQMNNVRGGTLISCNEPCLNTSIDEPCHCNTSRRLPCDCHTRLSACCNTSDDDPCIC